ncbi:hypothetical protein POM88_014106 [Heracleum sosnowskyi]|uniref:Uncharacterized protein n=1 Tax=Heracleum sosnowskyi TaxID=360622 RepID=A0AAD8J3H2_9APIA|nr:hypothetical protein POM88_014106 [Heracleum sosnowskyi]
MVIGSIHPLEQLCSFEIEDILQRRKGDNSKLDKPRRKTLNAYPGRRFKLIEGKLKFRTFAFGQELWTDLQDAKVCLSKAVQKYIDEIEDDVISPDEKALVEGLKEVLKEALNREDEARQKRKSEANKVTRRQHVASHDSISTLTATLAEDLRHQLYLSLTASLEILTSSISGISYCHQKHILVTTSLKIRILSQRDNLCIGDLPSQTCDSLDVQETGVLQYPNTTSGLQDYDRSLRDHMTKLTNSRV